MKYRFSQHDKKAIDTLGLPFSVEGDLTDEEELMLLESLMDKFGTDSKESYEKVYQLMAEQSDS